ncbi:single-stranded-DNA-specific exonuclease RecJ [Lentibacter algarum]|uniref:single-stranded-DNA-specific exonuclease RecJ n=1 Tax=Lentibacter algarum TaxID=576131 RepID=UPI001C06937C|nr:single-stranded-DNA-specific exonuclease RecJ [Lentibacter algarum]MBU2980914.1 single-stranded-DNA-specific exonuclease RecJ [Lentibacter algarum]
MSFLGITKSLTGRAWLGPSVELDRAAEAIAQATGLPRALSQVLARRGVAASEAEAFLAPQLRDLLPDPRSLKDMELASSRLVQALDARERIAVFADYDVDGGTSAALLLDWLRQQNHDATLYIPDRIDEGYGPNAPAIEMLASAHDLIICVDCGTVSHEALAAAKGTDVIVLDHHLGGETLPDVLAVVNPNRQDESGDLAHLCAAAVVFLTLVDAGRILREKSRQGPDLIAMLDLVALGTVADVAPLVGVNRAFVVQGLKVMSRRARAGLVALSDVGRLDTAPKAYHLGFVLGPRINAGGRIGKADLGARLLACTDMHEAKSMAERLDQLNSERRAIEDEVRAAALAQAEERGLDLPLVWAAGEGWHAGVVGIVASRLKEATGRPAVVIGFDGDEGKGSGRSVSGIDLGASVQKLMHEELIEKGGGHKMAAGLSLSRAQLEPAMARLSELLDKQGAGALGPSDLRLDGALMPGAATEELVNQLEAAGPYGAAAPGPRFAFPDCAIHFAKKVGESHLRLTFSDGTGPRLNAIAFGAYDTALGPALENHGGARFHLTGRLELNTWQGRTSVQLRLDDAAPANT